MSYYEKPKGQPKLDDDFSTIVREFYWRLFLQLMIPALSLGFVFWLPTVFINNLPDRLTAQCTTYNENIAMRIISQTEQINITNYYWSNDSGNTWHPVFSIESDYRSAVADCANVIFANDITQISTTSGFMRINADGFILRQ